MAKITKIKNQIKYSVYGIYATTINFDFKFSSHYNIPLYQMRNQVIIW